MIADTGFFYSSFLFKHGWIYGNEIESGSHRIPVKCEVAHYIPYKIFELFKLKLISD